jgi:hypothetical protein
MRLKFRLQAQNVKKIKGRGFLSAARLLALLPLAQRTEREAYVSSR